MPPSLSLLLPFALAACAPTEPPPATPAPTPATAAMPVGGDRLEAYHWRLRDAVAADGSRIDALFASTERPLQLDFSEGRLGVSGGCNHIGGSYTREGDTLRIDELMQTLMACEQALMAQDAAANTRLQGELQLRLDDGDPPMLALTTAKGDRLRFEGAATADTRYGGAGETVFLEVAAQRIACNHPLIPDMQCLRVREVHYDAQGLKAGAPGEWQPLYEEIEGYTHEPGVRNVLRVKRYAIENPPADASSIAYVLDMTVESSVE
ncbi:META and DUF4377 domain-containing protein [Luteimonas suaedae]|uniref:META and DUF4377 domain-containing protein n=1 Tax=Luteimonas suaedae TaxID=2605430 RepID=UPI0011EC6BFE|nr:META and DUF4377 domain-containing protein [Luteimonas suaedae]